MHAMDGSVTSEQRIQQISTQSMETGTGAIEYWCNRQRSGVIAWHFERRMHRIVDELLFPGPWGESGSTIARCRPYSYDGDANLTMRSDGASLTHDPQSADSIQPGYDPATYLHDPMGRRISKTVDGMTTWFLWDGVQLLAE